MHRVRHTPKLIQGVRQARAKSPTYVDCGTSITFATWEWRHMGGPTQLLIGGKFQDAVSGKTFPSINPATEEVLAQVAEADAPDIDAAVSAARAAFDNKKWRTMAARDRSKLLWKLGDLIMQHADELALTETMDNGKPLFESRNVDIPMAAETFYYYAGWCTKIEGETIPVPGNLSELHAARTLWRLRHHHTLELSAADGRLETGARAGLRQYGRTEDCRGDAAQRPPAGTTLPGSGISRRRRQCRPRLRRNGRARPGGPSGRR